MPTEANRYPDDVPPVARDGWPWVAALALAGAAAGVAGICLLAALLWAGAVFVVWFFRDPRRASPQGDDILLSPADGTVLGIEEGVDDPDVGKATVVSIFMSVFNVHINRCPLDGTVAAVRPHRGDFLAAYRREAAAANERTETVFQGARGAVKCVQIAGLIARRIVCRLSPGERVLAGQRYGLIKFGSRVDVYLPSLWRPAVGPGDAVRGGLTVLARAAAEVS